MGHIALLDELAIIAAVSVLVTVLLSRLQLPTVAGLLAAGTLVGPYGLGIVTSQEAIETLAEIGVVMLLFTIGLEFSLGRLQHIFKQVALGGFLQVGLSTAAGMGVARAMGESFETSLFYGFAFALSSTAIVLRALSERRELDAPHGQFIVGTLIFQDLCVVPMMLIVSMLGEVNSLASGVSKISSALVKAALLVTIILFAARFIVPKLLDFVAASRSREVFLLAVLSLCIGTAWLTAQAELSLALGAFLGGMVVADTQYGHRAMGDILPLRDAFLSIFFVSLGMLFDVRVVHAQPVTVGLLLVGFLLGKAILATFAAQAMRFPARVSYLAGVGLAQFGEFGFVLSQQALRSHVVTSEQIAPMMAAGILSMFLTPILMRLAPHFTAGEKLLLPLEKMIGVKSMDEMTQSISYAKDHIILVGYGVGGRIAAAALEGCQIPFAVLELNAASVRQGRADGLPIYYADATSEEALGHAHLKEAKALVLLINDFMAAQRIVDTAKRLAPHVPILMRTRYLAEKEALMALGVEDVVAEEVEGGMETLSRLMRWCNVPLNLITQQLKQVRQMTQTTQRDLVVPRAKLAQHQDLAELKIESVSITPASPALNDSVVGMQIRQRTKALVVAIKRGEDLLEPGPDLKLQNEDIVYLVGSKEAIAAAMQLFYKPSKSAAPQPLVAS